MILVYSCSSSVGPTFMCYYWLGQITLTFEHSVTWNNSSPRKGWSANSGSQASCYPNWRNLRILGLRIQVAEMSFFSRVGGFLLRDGVRTSAIQGMHFLPECQLVNQPAIPKLPLHLLPLMDILFERISMHNIGYNFTRVHVYIALY